MKAIDKIIFNELALRKTVVLPGAGTLGVVRHAAEVKVNEVKSPVNQVVYSKQEAQDVHSVISIMESMGMSHEAARTVYGEWLCESRGEDGALNISGVGEVKNDRFTPAVELEQMLNPVRSKPATAAAPAHGTSSGASTGQHSRATHYAAGGVPPYMYENRRNSNLLTNILLGLIILLLLGFAVLFIVDRVITHRDAIERELRVAGIVERHGVVTKPAPSVVGKTAEQSVAATPLPTAAAVARNYHVIAGSFLLESSADELVARLRRSYPDLAVEKIYTPAWVMVSVYQGQTHAEADEARRRLDGRLGVFDMWIHRKR